MNNRGYQIEKEIKEEWKGSEHSSHSVDFQTDVYLVEVKSCNLLNFCTNGNDKRPFVKQPHKRIRTFQSGRFVIWLENHLELKKIADKENKAAIYIFAIDYKGQKIVEKAFWNQIDKLMKHDKKSTEIKICDVFREFEICS